MLYKLLAEVAKQLMERPLLILLRIYNKDFISLNIEILHYFNDC